VVLANDGVTFPITNAFTVVCRFWSFVNIDPVWYARAVSSIAVTFPIEFSLMPELLVQLSFGTLV